ncbi:MAG: class I SAM-dependent methyltransferase [Candidatus Dojkabacteria bacterium]|nr:class I SAM-dependent methyltransferase [Candidatus Dojkabacteria bacterium]
MGITSPSSIEKPQLETREYQSSILGSIFLPRGIDGPTFDRLINIARNFITIEFGNFVQLLNNAMFHYRDDPDNQIAFIRKIYLLLQHALSRNDYISNTARRLLQYLCNIDGGLINLDYIPLFWLVQYKPDDVPLFVSYINNNMGSGITVFNRVNHLDFSSFLPDDIEYATGRQYKTTWGKYITPYLKRLGLNPSKTVRFLDLGCGEGNIWLDCKERYIDVSIHYIGIDVIPFNSWQQHQLRIRNDSTNKKVTFVCADMLNLPFPDCSVDLVYSNNSLMYPMDKLAVLKEIFRVLQVGGFAYIILPTSYKRTGNVGNIYFKPSIKTLLSDFFGNCFSLVDPTSHDPTARCIIVIQKNADLDVRTQIPEYQVFPFTLPDGLFGWGSKYEY